MIWLDIEGSQRPQTIHEVSCSCILVAHGDPQKRFGFSMSNLHHRSPVTETLPPFIFIIRHTTLPGRCSILLWKNGHYLTVQFPEPTDPPKDSDDYLHSEVGKLQSFANSLVFGKTNWAYFVNNKNDKRTLAYRQKPRSGVQYTPFAPLVHESELTFIRPVQGDLIEGIWKGQQGTLSLIKLLADPKSLNSGYPDRG